MVDFNNEDLQIEANRRIVRQCEHTMKLLLALQEKNLRILTRTNEHIIVQPSELFLESKETI